ncbi:MAG: J domain-containing protein [Nitrospinota bacterium]
MALSSKKRYSPYSILGLPDGTGLPTVKKRYRRLASKFHPDSKPENPNANKIFDLSTKAYKTILELHSLETRNRRDANAPMLSKAQPDISRMSRVKKTKIHFPKRYRVDTEYDNFLQTIRDNLKNYLAAVKKYKKT